MEIKVPCIDQSALGKRGIFYVGGHYAGEPGNSFVADQMFVEVYVPKTISHPYPLICFHGAGQTNVNWLTTPDGRMGWADYFVGQGYVVYLAEQPSRGRSAYHPDVDGPRKHHALEDLQRRFMGNEGNWPQAKGHIQFPGSTTDRTDETYRQFAASQVEYLNTNKKSQELVLACGKELFEKTGPAILVTHSQAGPFGWLLADSYPDSVKGIVALEPSGPPFSTDLSNPVAKNYGIAEVNMHFSPAIKEAKDIALKLLKAPSADLSDGWVFQEPAPQLPNLSHCPILLLCSECSYHAGYDHLTSYVLTQMGVPHEFVRMENWGIHGNGHMSMLEKNNLEIADAITRWLTVQNL